MIRIMAGVALLSTVAAHAPPQQQAPSAGEHHAVAGTVADEQGTPLARAEVELLSSDSVVERVRTDSAGRFRLDAGDRAKVTLRVRLVGYAPKVVPVPLHDAERVATVFVELEATAHQLAAMQVAAADDDYDENAATAGFYDRRAAHHFGYFVDQADLRRMHAQQLSDALRAVPGIIVRPGGLSGEVVRARNCQGSAAQQSGPLIWVDGVRAPGAELDEVARPAQVAGIEVYTSDIGVPGQFVDQAGACGTILVWTRDK